jgi:hypothetical protein
MYTQPAPLLRAVSAGEVLRNLVEFLFSQARMVAVRGTLSAFLSVLSNSRVFYFSNRAWS